MFSVSNPGLTFSKPTKVRVKSPAPISSPIERATSATVRRLRSRRPPSPVAEVFPPSLLDSLELRGKARKFLESQNSQTDASQSMQEHRSTLSSIVMDVP